MGEGDETELERRRVARARIGKSTRLHPNQWSTIEVEIVDLSPLGFRSSCAALLTVGGILTVEIAGIGRVAARVVWRSGADFGARFVVPIDLRHCGWLEAKGEAVVEAAPLERPVRQAQEALAAFHQRLRASGLG